MKGKKIFPNKNLSDIFFINSKPKTPILTIENKIKNNNIFSLSKFTCFLDDYLNIIILGGENELKEINNKIYLFFSNKIAISIFDFHSGEFIKQLNCKDIISMLIWNDNYLILSGKKLYLLNLNVLNEIKCISDQKILNSYNLIKVKINNNQEYIYQLLEYKNGINIWKVSY